MIRDLVCKLDYSIVAEVALTLFTATFLIIFYGAIRLSRSATDRFASIPLNDDVRDPIR
ncbi:MAG: hypothetical protein AAFU85_12140 [Planctomycetota bacterium]